MDFYEIEERKKSTIMLLSKMAKTKEELIEVRKQWFQNMEQKLQEMYTKEDDSLFYYHSLGGTIQNLSGNNGNGISLLLRER